MIIRSIRSCYLFSLLASGFLTAFTGQAQQPADPKDPITITVGESGWSADGSLVLAVRIHAPRKQDVKLFHGTMQTTALNPHPNYSGFSLGDSYLLDGYTGQKIQALSNLPSEPSYGPMATAMYVAHGNWVQLGVAFPTPPPPPPGKDGKPQPYKLLFYTSLGAAPVAITPPAK